MCKNDQWTDLPTEPNQTSSPQWESVCFSAFQELLEEPQSVKCLFPLINLTVNAVIVDFLTKKRCLTSSFSSWAFMLSPGERISRKSSQRTSNIKTEQVTVRSKIRSLTIVSSSRIDLRRSIVSESSHVTEGGPSQAFICSLCSHTYRF